jgi:predicted nucleic acid-binding protein
VKFADTSYLLALLNPDDEFYDSATALSVALDEVVVTTMWVLTELGDALHRGRNRETFVRFLDMLSEHEDFEVVPASPELFQRGVELFRARSDKEWSLTDCISFVVMAEKGLSEALTGDRHSSRRVSRRCSSKREDIPIRFFFRSGGRYRCALGDQAARLR